MSVIACLKQSALLAHDPQGLFGQVNDKFLKHAVELVRIIHE
jgi:hypothetical protein